MKITTRQLRRIIREEVTRPRGIEHFANEEYALLESQAPSYRGVIPTYSNYKEALTDTRRRMNQQFQLFDADLKRLDKLIEEVNSQGSNPSRALLKDIDWYAEKLDHTAEKIPDLVHNFRTVIYRYWV